MRYIIVMVWAVLLGQVVGYIGSALSQQSYNFPLTFVISIVLGILALVIGQVALPENSKTKSKN